MKSIVNPIDKKGILIKLNNTKLEHSEFIGIVCCVIYSKEIFPKNKDIVPFLDQVFNVEYLQYILNSRTLISARISRELIKLEGIELEKRRKKMVKYFDTFGNEKLSFNKKKDANDKLNVWLKGL